MEKPSGTSGTAGTLYTCSLCGHRWVSRKDDGLPKSCPKCRSTVWMKEYLRCKCLRCGHEWGTARGHPKKCPKCHSIKWDVPASEVRSSSGSRLDAEESEEVISRYEKGMGCTAISIDTGISFGEVHAALRAKYPGANIRI
jgi:DNA-directed RNA polymerase subunit RPC12/RpoP